MKDFNITGSKGFKLQFPNGVKLSTQFGYCNYGDNYDGYGTVGDQFTHEKTAQSIESNKVEIAIILEDGTWITKEYMEQSERHDSTDDVIGYVGMSEWLEALEWAKNYVPKETE